MLWPDNHLYEFGPFVLDAQSRILLRDGTTVRLTPKAFDTLLVLIQHGAQVVDKEQLLKEVWPDTYVEEGSLSRNIHELRKALGDDSSEPRYIETIPKRGYRFLAPVKISVSEVHIEAELVSSVETPAPAVVASAPKRKSVVVVAAVAGVLLLTGVVGTFIYLRRHKVSPLPVAHAKTTLTRLTNNSALDAGPTWSPDGSRIAFWSNRDGKTEIYVMNADGSNVKRLTNNLSDEYGPKWSPDGSKLAFSSNRAGMHHIYTVNADGSSPTQITAAQANDTEPAWSRDGKRIAFVRTLNGNAEIFVVNADGRNETRLTLAPALDTSPNWSPDGRIFFTSNRDGHNEIYVMRADGGAASRFTNIGATSPASSADGSRVAFISQSPVGWLEVFVANPDGSDVRMVTKDASSTFAPCWLGATGVAYAVDHLGTVSNIFQSDLNGGNHRRLTAGPKIDARPAVSPDGSKIAFESNRNGNYEIYVMNLR